jgi:hypothetical protein
MESPQVKPCESITEKCERGLTNVAITVDFAFQYQLGSWEVNLPLMLGREGMVCKYEMHTLGCHRTSEQLGSFRTKRSVIDPNFSELATLSVQTFSIPITIAGFPSKYTAPTSFSPSF